MSPQSSSNHQSTNQPIFICYMYSANSQQKSSHDTFRCGQVEREREGGGEITVLLIEISILITLYIIIIIIRRRRRRRRGILLLSNNNHEANCMKPSHVPRLLYICQSFSIMILHKSISCDRNKYQGLF